VVSEGQKVAQKLPEDSAAKDSKSPSWFPSCKVWWDAWGRTQGAVRFGINCQKMQTMKIKLSCSSWARAPNEDVHSADSTSWTLCVQELAHSL